MTDTVLRQVANLHKLSHGELLDLWRTLNGSDGRYVATVSRQPYQENTSRSCVECGKVFEFQRRNRVFCSEACQKRYGRRKAKNVAQEAADEGVRS